MSLLTNSHYQQVFRLTPLPTIILSLKAGILIINDVNNAYLDLFGAKLNDIQGKSFIQWHQNEYENLNFHLFTTQIDKSLSAVLKTKKKSAITIKLKNVEIESSPIFDDNGNVESIVQVIKPLDIQQNAEILLSSIITNTEEAFIVLNRDLLLTSFNEQFYKLYLAYFGIEVAVGESILTYAKPNRRADLKKLYKNILSGKKEYSTIAVEYQGEIKKLSIKYNPITDSNKAVIGIFITILDDTQLKKFKSQLNTREQELALIFDNLNETIFLITLEGNKRFKFIAVNKAFTQLFGLSENQIIGKYVEEILPKDSLATVLKKYKKAITSKSSVKWEETANYPIGEKTVFVTITPIFDENNHCIELIGSINDITEKVKSTKLLEESQQRFKNLVQEGSDLIAILDLEGNYKYVSPTSIAILGKKPEEFIGKNAFNFIHPDDAENVLSTFSKVGVEKRISSQPYRFKHRDGTWRWLETIATDMSDETSIKGIVANSRDITDKIAAQKEIILSNERYKLVAQATSDAIWDWDFIGDKIYWGEGFQLLFGYLPDELASNTETWTSKIHPQDVQRILTSINAFIDSEETNWVGEYRYLNSNGTYNYVLDKGFLIRDESGKAIRMVGSLQDINQRKKEEHQLKLLESVIINTNDPIVITEAEPIDGDGPRILYVNNAFTQLTGYTAEEVIGKTPRFLQGPKTDRKELDRLKVCLKNWESCEITVVNYKKNGDEFWINMSISPVADDKGWFTHWICVGRDVTEIKNQELQKLLLNKISQLFNTNESLNDALNDTLKSIVVMGDYCAAEVWLIDEVKQEINLATKHWSDESNCKFYEQTEHQSSYKFGEGLFGSVWKSKTVEFWDLNDENLPFLRMKAAKEANLKNWIGLPLFNNDKVNGVLILGSRDLGRIKLVQLFSRNFGKFFGAEIKRKQLEQELSQFFNFAPDIITITDLDGYFRKINPAACELLEYSIDEFLGQPLLNFIHPDDRKSAVLQFKTNRNKSGTYYFENRYLTKSGRVKWLAWSSNTLVEEGLIFSVAIDITDEKNLSALLLKSNSMGKVGSWEIDVISGTVYWSDITHEIRETEPGFIPNLNTGIHYFKEGKDKETIAQKVHECITVGTPWDEELQIITFKGNLKWVRTIGQAEMVNGKCIRIYGSFQDIDERKKNEIKVQQALLDIEESEKRYSELFHLSPIPKWVYEIESQKFLDVNQAAIKHYGYTYEEFLTMTIKDIRPIEEIGKLEEFMQENRKNKAVFTEGIFIHQTKTGVKLTVEIKSSFICYKGKNAKVIVANDITERIAYLNALEQHNIKLQEISWMQSHDIRAPLARLMGLVSLLNNKSTQTEIDERVIINYITQSADELDGKIKEIVKKSSDNSLLS